MFVHTYTHTRTHAHLHLSLFPQTSTILKTIMYTQTPLILIHHHEVQPHFLISLSLIHLLISSVPLYAPISFYPYYHFPYNNDFLTPLGLQGCCCRHYHVASHFLLPSLSYRHRALSCTSTLVILHRLRYPC